MLEIESRALCLPSRSSTTKLLRTEFTFLWRHASSIAAIIFLLCVQGLAHYFTGSRFSKNALNGWMDGWMESMGPSSETNDVIVLFYLILETVWSKLKLCFSPVPIYYYFCISSPLTNTKRAPFLQYKKFRFLQIAPPCPWSFPLVRCTPKSAQILLFECMFYFLIQKKKSENYTCTPSVTS